MKEALALSLLALLIVPAMGRIRQLRRVLRDTSPPES